MRVRIKCASLQQVRAYDVICTFRLSTAEDVLSSSDNSEKLCRLKDSGCSGWVLSGVRSAHHRQYSPRIHKNCTHGRQGPLALDCASAREDHSRMMSSATSPNAGPISSTNLVIALRATTSSNVGLSVTSAIVQIRKDRAATWPGSCSPVLLAPASRIAFLCSCHVD